jgi:glycerophosphoryl diester phosphodiesterase
MLFSKAATSLATLAIVFVSSLVAAAPAAANHAQPGDHVYGHRCRTYDRAVTNENTVAALIDTAGVPGAVCEIDAVTISDGTVIVWHDSTWNRVADHGTLPTGIAPRDPVRHATWAQVSQIRTKGGEPVARLQDMIDVAGLHGIALVVDMRTPLPNPAGLVSRANQAGADVGYFQRVKSTCSTRIVDRFRAAGAKIGVKLLGDCALTPAQLQARGVSFTQELSTFTDAYLADMQQRGIAVGVLDTYMTETLAESLVSRGVSRVLLDRPREALSWFS